MAFLVCSDFSGESGLRKLGLCGVQPLTGVRAHIELVMILRGYLKIIGSKPNSSFS